jgi:signal transduction histidine kinase
MMSGHAAKNATSRYPPAAGDLPCLGDRRRIKQVLLNLLSNAVKFTPAGGHVKFPPLLAGGSGDAVTDTGIGIAPQDIPRALERFGQVDSSLSRRYEGTGWACHYPSS